MIRFNKLFEVFCKNVYKIISKNFINPFYIPLVEVRYKNMLCLRLNITFTSEVDIYIIKTSGLKIIYCLYLLFSHEQT